VVELPGVRCVPDLRPGREGPLAGIEAGLTAARHDSALVVAGDMPFVSESLLELLVELVAEPGVLAAVPRYGGRMHPLCAAYDREALPALRSALDRDMRAVHEFLERLDGVRFVEDLGCFGNPELFLMNVNTPEDLQRARAGLPRPCR
jgi:molybdopterin-guanine dinucleotide biosynthesis protein A